MLGLGLGGRKFDGQGLGVDFKKRGVTKGVGVKNFGILTRFMNGPVYLEVVVACSVT